MKSSSPLIGIIGGSGLYTMKEFQLEKKVSLVTPFGRPSDAFLIGKLSGRPVIFLPRHGVGHRISPSEINYRANIWGLKKLGVEAIFSVSAVGSLKEEIEPSHMVVVDQFIDRTFKRATTFFEKGIVAHVSLAHPLCERLRRLLIAGCEVAGATVHKKGTYLCMEGPAFSTRGESLSYRAMGADVIGMTNATEARVAREAEICYATLALSTDYDCWRETGEAVTTDEIIAVLLKNVAKAQAILGETVRRFENDSDCPCQNALANAILTDRKKIPASVKKRLAPIVGKYL